ncbi:MAG: polysaccharide deacetylase family protein [Polyangiaceae bacterium]
MRLRLFVLSTLTTLLAAGCAGDPADAAGDDPSEDALAQSAAGSACAKVKGLAGEGKLEETNCGVSRGPKAEKKIALVFTAGYFCEGGPTFLDTLKQYNAKASFFIMSAAAKSTDAASKCSVVLPRLIEEGHYVGGHSNTHPDMVDRQGGKTIIARAKFDDEVKKNGDLLRSKGVRGSMRYWMPPSETFNEEIVQWSQEDGLTTVHMTACPETRGDYLPTTNAGGKYTNDAIIQRTLGCEAKDPNHLNGAVLFFHLGVGTARPEADKFHNAFPTLMKELVQRGYTFVRIDEMLDPVMGGG